jgi:hypothetical protein
VVERTLGGLSKCRALLVGYAKHDENYLGLIQLACGLLCSGITGYTDSRPHDGIEIVS